jgi:hypothetical protein
VRAYGAGLQVERAEQAARHPVPAVLLAGTRDRGSDRYKAGSRRACADTGRRNRQPGA